MSPENPALSYTELVNEIKNYCDNMISGTLLIVTETNLLIRIVLDEGKITGLICGPRHGMDVIPDLQNITTGRLKFSASKMGASREGPLPTTQEILGQLFTKPGRAAGNASAGESAGNIGGGQIAAVLDIIEKELIEFLGPMASIVWEEHMSRMEQPIYLPGLKALINELGKEIGNVEKADTFKKRIKEKVDSM